MIVDVFFYSDVSIVPGYSTELLGCGATLLHKVVPKSIKDIFNLLNTSLQIITRLELITSAILNAYGILHT